MVVRVEAQLTMSIAASNWGLSSYTLFAIVPTAESKGRYSNNPSSGNNVPVGCIGNSASPVIYPWELSALCRRMSDAIRVTFCMFPAWKELQCSFRAGNMQYRTQIAPFIRLHRAESSQG